MHIETAIFQNEAKTIIILDEKETLKEYHNINKRKRFARRDNLEYLNDYAAKLRISLINILAKKNKVCNSDHTSKI